MRLIAPGAVAGMILATGLSAPHAGAAQPASGPAAAAVATPGKAAFESACRTCHDLGVVTGQRKSRQGWEDTVAQMMSRGLAIDGDQADKVVDYLAKAYPAN
jgi:cytochrome c5